MTILTPTPISTPTPIPTPTAPNKKPPSFLPLKIPHTPLFPARNHRFRPVKMAKNQDNYSLVLTPARTQTNIPHFSKPFTVSSVSRTEKFFKLCKEVVKSFTVSSVPRTEKFFKVWDEVVKYVEWFETVQKLAKVITELAPACVGPGKQQQLVGVV